jgi:hypothetical protein
MPEIQHITPLDVSNPNPVRDSDKYFLIDSATIIVKRLDSSPALLHSGYVPVTAEAEQAYQVEPLSSIEASRIIATIFHLIVCISLYIYAYENYTRH